MKVKPIKSIEKVEQMKVELSYCETKGMADKTKFEKLRNRVIFCTGINTALRVSDLTSLDLIDIFHEDLTFREIVGATEQKTKKYKEFAINDTLKKELTRYIIEYFYTLYKIPIGNINNTINFDKVMQYNRQIKEIVRTKPLFPSERTGEHISRYQVDRFLKSAGKRCGLENVGTHTMRKTFRLLVLSKNKRYCNFTKDVKPL